VQAYPKSRGYICAERWGKGGWKGMAHLHHVQTIKNPTIKLDFASLRHQILLHQGEKPNPMGKKMMIRSI
jgi:hypothetical protein